MACYVWKFLSTTALECPGDLVYGDSVPKCQRTCVDQKAKNCKGGENQPETAEGCMCPNDLYQSGTKCVEKRDCGCSFRSYYFQVKRRHVSEKHRNAKHPLSIISIGDISQSNRILLPGECSFPVFLVQQERYGELLEHFAKQLLQVNTKLGCPSDH